MQNKGTFLRNIVQNSVLGKFGCGTSSVTECDQQATVVGLLWTTFSCCREEPRRKGSIGYNGTAQLHPKAAPSPLTITTPI